MEYVIYIISISILIISLVVTQLCTRKIGDGRKYAIVSSIVYVTITELLLTVGYMVTHYWLCMENFGTALLYFQTFSAPMALVLIQFLGPATSKIFKVSMIFIILGLFNLLYFSFDILYTPGWAYSIIIDVAAIVVSIFFPVSTTKAILLEFNIVFFIFIRVVSEDYFDYLRNNVDKYLLICALSLLIYMCIYRRTQKLQLYRRT